ncbi:MAG: Crp/Fnr family transcriptional regulator [Clostridia bacterium]|nr:Crp/Fnr family transcriptional regulator [Clostridia bacterium]
MTVYTYFPAISKNSIFAGTQPDSVNRFLTPNTLRLSNFLANQVIYSSKSEKLYVGVLCSGSAQVQAGSSEEYAVLNTLREGDMFGVANLYAQQEPFPTRIVSAGEAQVLFIDGDAFRQWIENDHCALRNYLTFQSGKLMYLNRKILTFTAGSAEKKLSLFLLDRQINGKVTLPCSMSGLADQLGIGRASLYRAVDSLIQGNLLERKDKDFFLPDPDALKRRYETP